MPLWSGRLPGGLEATAARLNASLPFDKIMAAEDVRGSQAWARALGRAGVLAPADVTAILDGLEKIRAEFSAGSFVFDENDEDIHTAVERRLTELIGPTGGKLHTGRSRNDQVSTDFRLWVLAAAARLGSRVRSLQAGLVARAEADWDVVLPGYTHFQQAQPILLSHWWLSHFWALERDAGRLKDLTARTAISPLGCGALAGTAFPIDRFALAADLGFSAPAPNSLDAIADRDFAVEFLFWAALTGVHLSHLAEALILYSTREYGFISLADAYSTGSSLMPQKKNPDLLELARGKSGTLIGKLAGLLATLKGLPSAYDKDLQEDKPPVFEAAETMEQLLAVMSGILATLTVHAGRMEAALDPALLATDLADYLVHKGIPFRTAHVAVGQAVRRAADLGVSLAGLPLAEWQAIHPEFTADLYASFDVKQSLARRSAWGGTAPQAVQEQLALAKKTLAQ